MKIRFITLIATMICSSNVWGNFTIDQLTYGVSSEEIAKYISPTVKTPSLQ